MKVNKLKLLTIVVCSLISALWSETQCMDDQIKNDVPTGSIVSFSGEIAPDGWLLCDGKQYTSQNYPELYEVVKEKYIPDSEQWVVRANQAHSIKIFYVPDLRGRVIIGVDNGVGRVTSNNTLGASGGEEKHQLTVDELAEHAHDYYYGTNNGGNSIGYSVLSAPVTSTNKEKAIAIGGNQPHNNMQPYQVLSYIIKSDEKTKYLRAAFTNPGNSWVPFDHTGWRPMKFTTYEGNDIFKGDLSPIEISEDGVYSLSGRYMWRATNGASDPETAIAVNSPDEGSLSRFSSGYAAHFLSPGQSMLGSINRVTRLRKGDKVMLAIACKVNAEYYPYHFQFNIERIF